MTLGILVLGPVLVLLGGAASLLGLIALGLGAGVVAEAVLVPGPRR